MRTDATERYRNGQGVLLAAILLGAALVVFPAFGDRFYSSSREGVSVREERPSAGLELIPEDEFRALVAKSENHFDASGRERAAFIPSRLPAAHSLKPYLPPAQDQGSTPQCVAYSLCYIKSAQEAVEELWDADSLHHQFSPSWLYSRIPHGPTGGTRLTDGLEFLKREGCMSMTASGSRGGRCYRIHDYYAVDPKSTSRLKSLIAGGIPIAASVQSMSALKRHRGDGVLTTYDATPADGYHALTVIGYDDRRGRSGAFLVQNSWGKRWGDGRGCGWIGYSLFTRICREAFYAVDAPNSQGR